LTLGPYLFEIFEDHIKIILNFNFLKMRASSIKRKRRIKRKRKRYKEKKRHEKLNYLKYHMRKLRTNGTI
jgi:hypothetical protein